MAKSDKINKAPKGKSFMYEPKPEPARTPCPKCERGHVVWIGTQQRYHFECSLKKCDWISNPLTTGNGPKRLKHTPKALPKPKIQNVKFDESFISETKTTITIRHRDGEILTIPKNFRNAAQRKHHARHCSGT